jgi:phenolic acid decarboxylase
MALPLIGKHLVYEIEGLGIYEAYYQCELIMDTTVFLVCLLWSACAAHDRIVYKIHGGPMKGRSAYQRAFYQQIGEDVYMISWIEGMLTELSLIPLRTTVYRIARNRNNRHNCG